MPDRENAIAFEALKLAVELNANSGKHPVQVMATAEMFRRYMIDTKGVAEELIALYETEGRLTTDPPATDDAISTVTTTTKETT